MKLKSLIAFAALGVAVVGTQAQEATSDSWMHAPRLAQTAKSRAEVQAELAQARADGQLTEQAQYGVQPAVKPLTGKTREEVKADLARACAAGELSALAQYDVFDKPFVSTRTRSEVRAEAVEASRRGHRLSQGEAS